ncbi:indolepyruvate ferredoxin oxidoreductase, alpha subunit [Desulfofarcimen acetoxidans DSM 771]|uniref:Indolepyruvate oxidoreductase subunit IorA n=1 Tax=Desulfofarcimen acetoxidans (strain ATCC 49208 / DSM 771 / KCTC 5769 / VKM B-1644 / 5575) TaxID=485916 RepID=C8VVD8_DESAS|nr:indolepyruvate ferredoxin oxidoreductase subunit alpha [Desulfofarcimen acetoxidans]ACV61008.1 indolepyruvate ferredoxin oxidoreductase, alpha subunit [Desulfofarcimen acetoxidans DSM 771]
MKDLLSGNAAIARGAYEAGVKLGVGYPGTPSTEILENFAKYEGIYAQWSPNEKVALEVGIGASLAGVRVLVTMKHVGVNVAADPLLTFAYTGVNGGLVLLSADDPGMHSSQNEQDNRIFAKFAKIPMLEPSDSQEAKDMVGLALEISEKYDTPVLLRTTTRVAHSQSMTEIGERREVIDKPYQKNAQKYVMVPGHGRMRRYFIENRMKDLAEYSEKTPVNFTIPGDQKIGVITSGISYQYVREVLPDVSVLKLGMTFPLPEQMIKDFAGQVEKLYVVEELEPFIEEQLKIWGIEVLGKQVFPSIGEFSADLIRQKFVDEKIIDASEKIAAVPEQTAPATPVRPPVQCPGCPHRGVFYTLNRLKLVVTGDIGCYTLGALPPLQAMDTTVCMGASISMALGMEKAVPEMKGKTVAVIGDSTFFHSGITGLVDVVYNQGNSTVIILDNRTTAMTGHQENPSTGINLMGQPAPVIDIEKLARALGINRVTKVDPLSLEEFKNVVQQEIAADEPSVIIAQRPCELLVKEKAAPYVVDPDVCKGCKQCQRLGCPAMSFNKLEKKAVIDIITCVGCGLCVQICKHGALRQGGERNE